MTQPPKGRFLVETGFKQVPYRILPVNKHILHASGTILTKFPRKGAERVVGSTPWSPVHHAFPPETQLRRFRKRKQYPGSVSVFPPPLVVGGLTIQRSLQIFHGTPQAPEPLRHCPAGSQPPSPDHVSLHFDDRLQFLWELDLQSITGRIDPHFHSAPPPVDFPLPPSQAPAL